MNKICIEGEYTKRELLQMASNMTNDGIEVIYDLQGKYPGSNSMTGYLSKYYLESFKNGEIHSIIVKNFGRQGSNDAMMAAFIEDLCQLANEGIKIKVLDY